MTFLLFFIIAIVFFAHFSQRVSSVERRLQKLEAREDGALGQPMSSTAIPVGNLALIQPAPPVSTAATSNFVQREAFSPHLSPPADLGNSAPISVGETHQTDSPASPMKSHQEKGLEFQFGSKVLTSVGVVAVLFGMGYFLRYAFDNGLISETGRVVLGLVVGMILLGLGEWFSRKYPLYGSIVSGGGLGLLYLSLYAGFSFYGVFPMGISFVGMALVSLFGLFLAVRKEALALAVFAQVGGFLTPMLLSSGENHPHILFAYIFLLNLAVLGVAWLRRWRALMVVSLVGTLIVYLLWLEAYFTQNQFGVAMGYASLFFVLFLSAILVRHFRQTAQPDEADILATMLNAGVYFCIGYGLVHEVYPDSAGFFTLLLAFLHVGLALAVRGAGDSGNRLSKFFSAAAAVLFVLYVPVELDKSWLSIGWIAEAAVLFIVSFSLRSLWLRNLSLVIFFLAFLRLITWDAFGGFDGTMVPWANSRMLTLLIALAAYITVIVFTEVQNRLGTYEEFFDAFGQQAIVLIELQTIGILLWLGSAEILAFHRDFWLTMFFMFVAVVSGLMGLAVRRGVLVSTGHIILILSWISVILLRLMPGDTLLPIFNDRVVSVLGFAIVACGSIELIKKVGPMLAWSEIAQRQMRLLLEAGILLTTFWALSSEVANFFDYARAHQTIAEASRGEGVFESMKQVTLSIAWLVYAVTIVSLGIRRRSA